jgi:hypothetical protein
VYREIREMTEDERPVVDDETFMENVREALVNGYDRVCARCGVGTAPDNLDIHMSNCPEFDEKLMR